MRFLFGAVEQLPPAIGAAGFVPEIEINKRKLVVSREVCTRTRPAVLLGMRNEASPYRVAFDIT